MAAERKPPTSDQFFGSMFSRGQSKKDTEEKAIPCKILHVNHELSESVGCGVLVCNPQFDKSRKHFIITSKRVIENENFADECKVEFKRNSKVRTFDLKGVKKSVLSDAFGVMIIFIDSQNIKHMKYQKFPLTIANFDQNQTPFCYVANQCYNIESDHENGKYVLKRKNSDTSADQLTNATSKEMSNGTVILQGSGKENTKAVGIFNMEDATQMLISPIWLKPSITDILAPTTDGRQMSSPTDTVAVTATNERQSTVGSGGTTDNTTHNQELPAAGTHQATEATANQQPTAGANGTYPGAPPANELFPPPNGRGGVDGGERASEDDGNNGDGDPPQDPPNSTETSTGTQSYENLPAAPPSSTGANTTNNQELPAAGSDHTTEANQQPTAGPTDTGGQPNPTGPASMSSRPVQEEQGTVGNGHTSTGAERARQEETVSKQLVSEAVTENTLLLEKLSKMLDREIRIIKCWKHLAYILEVPDKIRKKWDMYTEHSPTEDLLSHVTNENPDLTVQQLKKKLETIFRNDVIEDLNKGGYKDEASVVELFAEDPKFNNILSRLDEKTMHNYKNLAKEFKINTLKIDQLGMRFSGGPTAFLFYYMSFTEGLKDLTMHQLRKHFEEMKLIKLAKIVTKATNEDSDLVKDVVVEGSDVLEEIADNLNHKKQSLKNWRHLAHKLGILRDVYESFDTSKEDSHSPTKIMFEWLQQAKPNLTVENLLDGLEQIERLDVKQEVTFALTKKKKQKSKNDSTQVYDTEKQAVHNLWRMSHDTDQAKKEKHDLSAGLREKAATQGLRIVDNDGKGNCMFSALCHQLEIKKGLTYLHVDLRTELVQYLRNHPDLNDFVDQEEYPTWDYYVDEMAKIGRWGDGVILLAAARHLQCVIRVISNRPDFPDVFLRPDGKELVELVLGHIFQYHFVSLEPEH